MANADGGEAMLFDKSGAARRREPRTRFCLIGLPEGEGSAFTLTANGVWLVQIPLAQKVRAAGQKTPPQLPRTAQSGPSAKLLIAAVRLVEAAIQAANQPIGAESVKSGDISPVLSMIQNIRRNSSKVSSSGTQ